MYYCENSTVYYYLCVLFIPLFLGHFVEKTTKPTGSYYDSIDEVMYALESFQRWVGIHCMTLHLLSKLPVSRFVLCQNLSPLHTEVVIYVYIFLQCCPFLDLYRVKICPSSYKKWLHIFTFSFEVARFQICIASKFVPSSYKNWPIYGSIYMTTDGLLAARVIFSFTISP